MAIATRSFVHQISSPVSSGLMDLPISRTEGFPPKVQKELFINRDSLHNMKSFESGERSVALHYLA